MVFGSEGKKIKESVQFVEKSRKKHNKNAFSSKTTHHAFVLLFVFALRLSLLKEYCLIFRPGMLLQMRNQTEITHFVCDSFSRLLNHSNSSKSTANQGHTPNR